MNHYNLTKRDVKKFAQDLFLKYMPFRSLTIFTPVQMLFNFILMAAIKNSSLEQVAFQAPNARCGKTLRNHLNDQLHSLSAIETSFNESFFALLPKSFWLNAHKKKGNNSIPLAVDWVEKGYYGKSSVLNKIRRGKPKNGTSRYFVYATLYTTLKGRRFTLAMTYVTPEDTTLSVLQRLHSYLSRYGLKAKYYLLDRQFYSVAVMGWLISKNLPYIIPAIIRGKAGSGTKKLKARKKSGWEQYEMKSSKEGNLEVEMAIVCFNEKKKKKRKTYVYATWGMRNKTLKWIKETYRKRFGIEVSHRQRNEFEVKTTTKDERARYFYMALGFLLRNIWVWLHWNVIGEKERGQLGKKLKLEEMTIDHLKTWLRSVIEETYPAREGILVCGNGPPEVLRDTNKFTRYLLF